MEKTYDQDLLIDKQGWNEYWNGQNRGGILYAIIAEFYRKVIIRPTLNYFITTNFAPGASLLHAGCGSGQEDVNITPVYDVTGLDISSRALEMYRQNNSRCHTLHASVFDIRMPDKCLDGIYNLGVMEHFNEVEIAKILEQFKRILKDDGKMVLFWPPEFGLSVLFFKALRGTIKFLSGKDVKFHPDEISRVQSKAQVEAILRRSGLKLIRYSFSLRDVFTYSVVVAGKA